MGRFASLLGIWEGTSWLNLRGWCAGFEKRLHTTFGTADPACHVILCAAEDAPSPVGHGDKELVVVIQEWKVIVDD